jgi:hypothetical protein
VLTDPRDEHCHSKAIQDGLQVFDFVLVDCALRQQHAINSVYLVPGSDNHAAQKVQIEFF